MPPLRRAVILLLTKIPKSGTLLKISYNLTHLTAFSSSPIWFVQVLYCFLLVKPQC